jgi:hypothetical protein
MSLYAKRLEKGRFIWPSPTAGVVGITASQLASCSMESIGGTRFIPSGRSARDSPTLHPFRSQRRASVIPCSDVAIDGAAEFGAALAHPQCGPRCRCLAPISSARARISAPARPSALKVPATPGGKISADQGAATVHPRLTSKIPSPEKSGPPGFPTASDVVSESP